MFTSGTSRRTRISALGLLLGSLVLNDIPVLGENSILQANDVRNPVHRQSDVRETAVIVKPARTQTGSASFDGLLVLGRLTNDAQGVLSAVQR
jgi:flagellar biosynthesis regulator FlbT